ncbi:MAG: D-alanine--D-alanine ligase family protein [Corynebacterium sp.]|nr:D-alanine--D-alanine ligase family protein [Corynebacterium sp.]
MIEGIMPEKIRVAVLYGGRSTEHSVSCVSAGAIMSHLDPQRFEIIPVGITTDGVWTVGTTDTDSLRIQDRTLPSVTLTDPKDELFLSVNPLRKGEIRRIDGSLYATADVIFPVLHGKFGEDGTIQGLFELSGVPYVGTGVLSSAAAMDKEYTRHMLHEAGLPIGKGITVTADGRRSITEADKEYLGLPVFVKPARGGSSIGVSKVSSWDKLQEALDLAFANDSKAIIEAENRGVEVECGVLEYADGRVVAVPPAQLQGTESGDEGFYGFDTKYLDNVVAALIPAPLDEKTLQEVQDISIKAFHAIDGMGLSRVDFFITENGPVINEINTMPGFTPISMYPQVFAAAGVSYDTLLSILIDQALSAVR